MSSAFLQLIFILPHICCVNNHRLLINLQSLPILDIPMTITSSHLILIPGLGDRKWLYCLVCPVWRLRGFRTHVFAFGWEDAASNYHEKQIRLNNYVRSLDGDVDLIGASAGGMAALHALAGDNGKIKGVATIATPYIYRQKLQNKFCLLYTSPSPRD